VKMFYHKNEIKYEVLRIRIFKMDNNLKSDENNFSQKYIKFTCYFVIFSKDMDVNFREQKNYKMIIVLSTIFSTIELYSLSLLTRFFTHIPSHMPIHIFTYFPIYLCSAISFL